MESSNYLNGESANRCESGEFSESKVSCVDQKNSLTPPGKLMAFSDHCDADSKISTSDWIKVETGNLLPQVDVSSYENEINLAKSIEAASVVSNVALLKLNSNRESIKLLRRSLKVLGRNLKSTKVRKSYDRKANSKSSTESIEEFVDQDYQDYQDYQDNQDNQSADESESETEIRKKNTRKCKTLEKDVYRENLYDQYDPKFAKRFPLVIKGLQDFWFYNGIFIQNGCSVKSPLPSYLVPWPESDLEPLLAPFLSDKIKRRVLKGMSQGKLYNIDYKRLGLIFTKRMRMQSDRWTRCPLCVKEYIGKANVIRHMETLHSNFTCFCGSCGRIYLRRGICFSHDCPQRRKGPDGQTHHSNH
ncbi:uncharacterized protein LOC128390848 isoform X2 [Panonychus citri]|uniref:uncharacterized protein LOC128390848 isoform X2 n=1 Tax=Panonychus citri TaxID=50023 RepID=UPI002307BC93|nr:uncharacterized protein LOC128390848 isoform X2 [Panonychus citri]